MKLNLGCGYNKLAGWMNVDLFPECAPDMVLDLEALPWPWPGDSAERVLFFHSLEHMGRETSTFLGMMKELYRVCRNGAQIEIVVPHPRHDNFINDPTHVRIITPSMFDLFNRETCDKLKAMGASNTPFAHYLHVDFVMTDNRAVLAEPYSTHYSDGLLSDDDITQMRRELNNVIDEYRMTLVVRKASQ